MGELAAVVVLAVVIGAVVTIAARRLSDLYLMPANGAVARVDRGILRPEQLVAGGLVLAWYYLCGYGMVFLHRVVFSSLMVVVASVNTRTPIIPNVVTTPGIVLGFCISPFGGTGFLDSILGALLGGGLPLVLAELYLRITGREGLGMGVVKLLAVVGAFLGWQIVALTMVLATVSAAVVGFATAGRRENTALAFGPFVSGAAIVAAIFGDRMVRWYFSFW